ncbi:MAG: GNAT family N-acetyltransferase, partial [Methylobacteriaceae bacterium]|nr:GNAT family N-acetyltransferase [Methylobacteriaceae bacterium]
MRVVPLDSERHLGDLFAAMGGAQHAHLWTYMFDGPFTDHAAFAEALRRRQTSDDPLFFAIEDKLTSHAVGV